MTDGTKESLGALWGKALAGTFEHLRKFLAVYAVFTVFFGSVGTTTWKVFVRPALAAEMKQELKDQLNAPCLKGNDGKRENTLACSIEADTEAIEELSEQFNNYATKQGAIETNQTIIQSDQATIKATQRAILEQLKADKEERKNAYEAILRALEAN